MDPELWGQSVLATWRGLALTAGKSHQFLVLVPAAQQNFTVSLWVTVGASLPQRWPSEIVIIRQGSGFACNF